jgi:hypothetical protein
MNLTELRENLRELTKSRLLAREHIEGVLSELERALVEALGDEILRAHHLHTRAAPYRGFVLRGGAPDKKFDDDVYVQVVLRDDGRFMLARLGADGAIEDRPLRVDDLQVDDFPLLVERVQYALEYHSARVDSTTARYDEIGSLAQRVSAALKRSE